MYGKFLVSVDFDISSMGFLIRFKNIHEVKCVKKVFI